MIDWIATTALYVVDLSPIECCYLPDRQLNVKPRYWSDEFWHEYLSRLRSWAFVGGKFVHAYVEPLSHGDQRSRFVVELLDGSIVSTVSVYLDWADQCYLMGCQELDQSQRYLSRYVLQQVAEQTSDFPVCLTVQTSSRQCSEALQVQSTDPTRTHRYDGQVVKFLYAVAGRIGRTHYTFYFEFEYTNRRLTLTTKHVQHANKIALYYLTSRGYVHVYRHQRRFHARLAERPVVSIGTTRNDRTIDYRISDHAIAIVEQGTILVLNWIAGRTGTYPINYSTKFTLDRGYLLFNDRSTTTVVNTADNTTIITVDVSLVPQLASVFQQDPTNVVRSIVYDEKTKTLLLLTSDGIWVVHRGHVFGRLLYHWPRNNDVDRVRMMTYQWSPEQRFLAVDRRHTFKYD